MAGRQKDAKAVWEWARRNGHDVPERGRIPSTVLQAYQRAAADSRTSLTGRVAAEIPLGCRVFPAACMGMNYC
ncbi:Lsr2 family DNA-binding protein [Nocardia sp. NPDC001965]